MFHPVETNVSFPALEQELLTWWEERHIVEKSLQSGERPFVFFEGPPTANGRPGFHHTISRCFKDVILRYRAMQGYRIIGRREGWDTHGLPVEIEVEKELGFDGKPDIERYGIAAFNTHCRDSVWRYIQEWKKFTNRIAYWVSDDAYITYENHYIESLWWVFRQLWDKGLLYRDYKVTMHCPRCGTSLSDHEVSQGFQDNVEDPSVWVSFPVVATAGNAAAHPLAHALTGASFVAWTTTPWTLPANVALCVKPDADYVVAQYVLGDDGDDAAPRRYIVAAALLHALYGDAATVTVERTVKGHELVGLYYEPLFHGVPAPGDVVDWTTAYHVIANDFVTLEDGTGIVHIAPAYGDYEIGKQYHLPTLFSVSLAGTVLPQYNELGFGGLFFKQADPVISRYLKQQGKLIKMARVRHSYPFCWRCDTPLLYFAKPSWYIRTTAVKEQMIANNQEIYWVPDHIRDGRFGNWLENNIDWAISRERYWGTPLPIWISDDGSYMECIGSLAELEAKVGKPLGDIDLHRPYVDDLTWDAPNGTGTMRRIPDVADCWFDSGAMQVAQWHYPFENEDVFAASHPADFICEAIDQTRGWFYTLHALGSLLFDKPAFTHVICLGHILDADGRKMSKRLGNIVNPWEVFDEYGVDALRWNLFSASPPGNPRRFSVEQVNDSLRQFLLTLWNTYAFFVTYANLDSDVIDVRSLVCNPLNAISDAMQHNANPNLIDRWALARLNALVNDVTERMEAYDVTSAARAIDSFVDELSNWYVRRNRRRFWKSEADTDKQAAYSTLYVCLVTVTKLAAPFVPFVSEAIYRNLVVSLDETQPESVHLSRMPQAHAALRDDQIVHDMQLVIGVVSLGRAARKTSQVRVRQPLSELWVRVPTSTDSDGVRRFESEIRDELNIKTVRYFDAATDFVDYVCKPNLRVVGKKFGKLVPALTTTLRSLSTDEARVIAHAVEAHQPVTLTIEGHIYELQADELLIETSSPDGYAVAESDGMLVALNTTITPALRNEGIARELVRHIQDARKNANLAISDRIVLTMNENGTTMMLSDVLQEWQAYIQAETLAVGLHVGEIPAESYRETVEVADGSIAIGITKTTM